MNEALPHALRAASLGYAVFPLGRHKTPAIRSPHGPGDRTCRGECGRPGHGVHDATNDADRIKALFDHAPNAWGYGIACGSGLVGLDLDRGHAEGVDGVETLRELEREHQFTVPATMTISTPSGGQHVWLVASPEIRVPCSAGRAGPGVDVRGHGGYLVGPGSRSPKGVYRVALAATVQPIPPQLLALLLPPERPAAAPVTIRASGSNYARAALEDEVQRVMNAHAGQRNDTLNRAAFALGQLVAGGVLDRIEVVTALGLAGEVIGLGASEVERTLASGLRAGAASPRRPTARGVA